MSKKVHWIIKFGARVHLSACKRKVKEKDVKPFGAHTPLQRCKNCRRFLKQANSARRLLGS